MGVAFVAFLLSVGIGGFLSFITPSTGVVASISIIGAYIIYYLKKISDK